MMEQSVFFNIIFLLTSMFRFFAIFKFMTIFFDERKIGKRSEIICYVGYFLINAFMFIFWSNQIINLLNNIILTFLLTFIYSSSFLKKLIALVIVCASNLFIESIVYYILLYFNLEQQTTMILGFIIYTIVYYLAVMLFHRFKNIKSNNKISVIYTVIIFSTSAFSIYLLVILMLMHYELQGNPVNVIIAISILMILNIFIIYIYDALSKEYTAQLDKKLLEQQNSFYLKQLDIMNQSQEHIKIFKHDMKHYFSTLKIMIDNGESVDEYLNNFLESIDHSGEYAQSGNSIVDSILNYKLQEAVNKGAEIDLKLKIPKELNIVPFDMGKILGNLFDNAIEAIIKKSDERRIMLSMRLEKNIIYIDITNTFDGNLIIEQGNFKTTKEDKFNHGLGLQSVKKIIEKYDGEINVSNKDNIFTVNALLYNN